jgi:catechol 2,3-dioxygenase-like lactoylglutathione lyase family enzyme
MQLGRVILFAKDVPRLGAFYRHVLGVEPKPTEFPSDEWMLFDTGGAELALHRVPEPWNADIEIADPPDPRHGSPHKIVFVVDDVAAARDELAARGAVVLENEHLNPPGRLLRCDMLDLEGNVFQVTGRDD